MNTRLAINQYTFLPILVSVPNTFLVCKPNLRIKDNFWADAKATLTDFCMSIEHSSMKDAFINSICFKLVESTTLHREIKALYVSFKQFS